MVVGLVLVGPVALGMIQHRSRQRNQQRHKAENQEEGQVDRGHQAIRRGR